MRETCAALAHQPIPTAIEGPLDLLFLLPLAANPGFYTDSGASLLRAAVGDGYVAKAEAARSRNSRFFATLPLCAFLIEKPLFEKDTHPSIHSFASRSQRGDASPTFESESSLEHREPLWSVSPCVCSGEQTPFGLRLRLAWGKPFVGASWRSPPTTPLVRLVGPPGGRSALPVCRTRLAGTHAGTVDAA